MKRTLIHLALAAATFVLALGAYAFWYSMVSGKSASVAQLEQQIQAKNATASYIASARSALTEIAGDEAAVQAYFVSESDVVSFINDLESRGSALGSNVQVLSVSTGKAGSHPALDLSITITGSFNAVMRTVGAIEFAPYDVEITSLVLSKGTNVAWIANVHLLVGSAPNMSTK